MTQQMNALLEVAPELMQALGNEQVRARLRDERKAREAFFASCFNERKI